MVLSSLKMCDTRSILNTPASDVHVGLKTTDNAIEIAKETTVEIQ